MSEYLVVIEHEGESWGAYCPDLPGLGVAGDTREEVVHRIYRRTASCSPAMTPTHLALAIRRTTVHRSVAEPLAKVRALPGRKQLSVGAIADACLRAGASARPKRCNAGRYVSDSRRPFGARSSSLAVSPTRPLEPLLVIDIEQLGRS